jgi:hypothetical protein
LQFVGRTRFGGAFDGRLSNSANLRIFDRLRNGADIAEKYFPFADKIRRKHFNQDLINGRDL